MLANGNDKAYIIAIKITMEPLIEKVKLEIGK